MERTLRERMKIPVFHDDQHGTAIVVGAAVINGLKVVGKDIAKVKLVASAPAPARRRHWTCWSYGPAGREHLGDRSGRRGLRGPYRADGPREAPLCAEDRQAQAGRGHRQGRHLLGLSAAGVLKQDMVQRMADKPLVLALANPNPEIMPELVKEVRPDAVIATGRTDYPNRVNNVLCFPSSSAAHSIAAPPLSRARWKSRSRTRWPAWRPWEQSDIVASAYGMGPVVRAGIPDPQALRSAPDRQDRAGGGRGGHAVRRRPAPDRDMDAYRQQLQQFVYHSGTLMKPIYAAARKLEAEKTHRLRRGRGGARAARGAGDRR